MINFPIAPALNDQYTEGDRTWKCVKIAPGAMWDIVPVGTADAEAAGASALLAKDWATKTSGEVVAGQGYGAKFYSDLAATTLANKAENADLADTTLAAKGAGRIGFSFVLAYAAGTLGAYVKSLVTLTGLATAATVAIGGYTANEAQDTLDYAKTLQSYTALRAYTGRALGVRITTFGVAGSFKLDAADTTSADDGGTIIVDASSRRWKRLFSSDVDISWFAPVADGVSSDTAAISGAVAASNLVGARVLLKNAATYLCGRLAFSRIYLSCNGAATIKAAPGSTVAGQAYVATADFYGNGITIDGANAIDRAIEATGFLDMRGGGCKNVVGTSAVQASLIYAKPTCTVFRVDQCAFSGVSGVENGTEGDISGADCGLYIETTAPFKIANSTFTNIGGWEDGDCIRVQLAADATLNWAAANGASIEGNSFPEIKKRAIKLQASFVSIRRNYITSTSIDALLCPYAGIELFGSYNTIADNFVDIERAVGCIIDNGNSNKIIDGNFISLAKSGVQLTARGAGTAAIRYISAIAGRCHGNDVKSKGVYGWFLSNAQKCVVSRNEHIVDANPAAYVAVYGSGGGYNIVSENTLSGTVANKIRYAVEWDNSVYNSTINNKFDNVANSGIRYFGTSAGCNNSGNSYPSGVANVVDYTGINATSAQSIRDLETNVITAVDPPSIAAGGQYTQDIAFQNAGAGTKVVINPTTALEAGLSYFAYGISAGTVRLFIQNGTAGAIDPASRSWTMKLAA